MPSRLLSTARAQAVYAPLLLAKRRTSATSCCRISDCRPMPRWTRSRPSCNRRHRRRTNLPGDHSGRPRALSAALVIKQMREIAERLVFLLYRYRASCGVAKIGTGRGYSPYTLHRHRPRRMSGLSLCAARNLPTECPLSLHTPLADLYRPVSCLAPYRCVPCVACPCVSRPVEDRNVRA